MYKRPNAAVRALQTAYCGAMYGGIESPACEGETNKCHEVSMQGIPFTLLCVHVFHHQIWMCRCHVHHPLHHLGIPHGSTPHDAAAPICGCTGHKCSMAWTSLNAMFHTAKAFAMYALADPGFGRGCIKGRVRVRLKSSRTKRRIVAIAQQFYHLPWPTSTHFS